jgi:hypothetical protein
MLLRCTSFRCIVEQQQPSAGSLAAFDVSRPSNGLECETEQHAAVFRVSA